MYLLISLTVSFILPAVCYCGNICPLGNAHNIQDIISPPAGTVQECIWHRVFCPEFRADEALDGLVWYKGSSIDSAVYLTGVFEGKTTIKSNRHELSTDYSLVIKGVDSTDEGSYSCHVVPRDTITRVGKVDLSVIGTRFPFVGNPASINRHNFKREGGRHVHTLQCQCIPRAPDAGISVVYWSTGEGVSTDTEIIGARFADGSVLQIQHGASYGIGIEFSLEINSLVDVHDEQRFWCHAYQSGGTRSSCYTDVTITGDQLPDSELRASKSSFYLFNGTLAILPCTSWEPGGPACDVQWFKVNNSTRHLLTYNLSTVDLRIESGFDLEGSLGLLVKMVDESTAGRYRCDIDGGRIVGRMGEAVDVLVIGNKFPLDGGDATAGDTVKLKPNTKFTLKCPVRFSNIVMNKTTIFWSFGAPGEQQSTTVIGNLVLPEGVRTMSDLGDNNCYGMSYGGSLVLSNCSQDKDVRHWCHVFKEGDVLHRSYVDVTVDVLKLPGNVTTPVAVTVCIVLLISVMVLGFVFLYRRKSTCTRRDVVRRGKYASVEMEDDLNATELVPKVKMFHTRNAESIPISPWIVWEKAYAKLDDVYVSPEMFSNVDFAGSTIKYRIDPEKELFRDGTVESCQSVLISGRAGSGKTTFLYKLAYDWATGRESLFYQKTCVFVLMINFLRESRENIGQAVVFSCNQEVRSEIFQKEGEAERLAKSINNYCLQNPNKVALLIDNCNEKEDIQYALSTLQSHSLSKCQTVIASRRLKTVHDTSKKHKMRYVTIAGFNPKDVHRYIDKVLGVKETKNTKHDQAKSLTERNPKIGVAKIGATIGNGQSDENTAKQGSTVSSGHEQAFKETEPFLPANSEESNDDKAHRGSPPNSQETNVDKAVEVSLSKRAETPEDEVNYKTEQKTSIQDAADENKPKVDEKPQANKTVDRTNSELKSKDRSTVGKYNATSSSKVEKGPKGKIPHRRPTDSNQNAPSLESPKMFEVNDAENIEGQPTGTGRDGKNVSASMLHEYINTAILPPKVTCLPANLSALCRLSLWTNGEVFISKPSMTELCTKLVTNIFERSNCRMDVEADVQTQEEGQEECGLNKDQLGILVDIGKCLLPIICSKDYESSLTFLESKFLHDCSHGRSLIYFRMFSGILVQEEEVPREADAGACSSSDAGACSTGFVSCSQKDYKIGFVLEILGEYCIGTYISHCKEPISTWGKPLEDIDLMQNAAKLQNVFVFASQPHSSAATRSKLVDIASKAINKDHRTAIEVVKLHEVIELSLKMYSEGKRADSKLERLIEDKYPVSWTTSEGVHTEKRNIRILGVSSHKIHLLSHFLTNHTKKSDGSSTILICIKLFRLGGFDFAELQNCIDSDMPEPRCSKSQPLEGVTPELGKRATVELATRLRKRISSGEEDLLLFPSSRSDVEVLIDIQSYGVLDLLESQAGDCCSPGAAEELVRCLSCQDNVKEIVLLGTISNSKILVDLANNLDKLGNLTKLDLRLNRYFDDSAFGAITVAVGKSTKLTDLRLSLYEVNATGFEGALTTMEETNTSWGRLKVLYLVHGSPVKKFVWFLTRSLKYFDDLEYFHISSSAPNESIPEDDLNDFVKEFSSMKPKTIMPKLKVMDWGKIQSLGDRAGEGWKRRQHAAKHTGRCDEVYGETALLT